MKLMFYFLTVGFCKDFTITPNQENSKPGMLIVFA